jgi:hypothetical protein
MIGIILNETIKEFIGRAYGIIISENEKSGYSIF